MVEDPAMVKAIRIAFRDAGVTVEHGRDGHDDDDVLLVDGWMVRPIDET